MLYLFHVVIGYFHRTPGAVSPARLVLSPCSFTLVVLLGARPCFKRFPFTARSSSDGFHVLRVVWWSPTWSSSEDSCESHCGAVFSAEHCETSCERLSCGTPTSAGCFEASMPLLPGSSRAPRTSEPSRSLRLLCLSCHDLVSVGACCCGAFRPLPWSSWSLRTPSLCTNQFSTLRCCLEHFYPLLGHTLLLLSVLVQAVLSTFLAPRPVAARDYLHREALRKVLCVFPSEPCPSATPSRDSCILSQRGSDVFDVAVASPATFSGTPFCRGVLTPRVCPAHFAVSPAVGVSRARHRLFFCDLRDAWLVLLSRRNVLLVLDLCPSPRRWRTRHSACASRDVITAAACS